MARSVVLAWVVMELRFPDGPDDRPEVQRLLANVKEALPELRALLEEARRGGWRSTWVR